MPQPSSGLRADLHRTRDHARAVGDARFELDVEITLILYLGEDPDTGRELTPARRLAIGRRPHPPPPGPRLIMKRTEARRIVTSATPSNWHGAPPLHQPQRPDSMRYPRPTPCFAILHRRPPPQRLILPRHPPQRETAGSVDAQTRRCYSCAQLKAGHGTLKPNKLIISRKGFDSGSGGCPSPIFPDGTMFSLPIPSGDEESFEDLQHGDVDIASVVSGITNGRVSGLRPDPPRLRPELRRVPVPERPSCLATVAGHARPSRHRAEPSQ